MVGVVEVVEIYGLIQMNFVLFAMATADAQHAKVQAILDAELAVEVDGIGCLPQ